ncbi:hypothetical protein ACFPIF_00350 [Brevundimonas faecalis]|uniref:hypothetical protein n=1 Tax=Brevundimonas faecalis TaxID=947378 RepID=UPI00360FD3AA
MRLRGERKSENGYEKALSGTVYWTLSLYIEASKVAETLGCAEDGHVKPDLFRRTQMRHGPSFALRNAVDPLMNDIADRETRGEVQEFLLSVADADVSGVAEDDLVSAYDRAAREYEDLTFLMPKSISWTTEGRRYHAYPPNLDDERLVRLRRFWMSHNNGALSYHLSFSHYYGEKGVGYDPSTYYFLSALQKLAAPKEYGLDPKILGEILADKKAYVDVLTEPKLGIAPLDDIRISKGKGKDETFWSFVKQKFEQDAIKLFERLATGFPTSPTLRPKFEQDLLELAPFIEVPGLKVPKSRFMFMLHDERFFDRLMPLEPGTGKIAARKTMVRQECYEPYQDRMDGLTAPVDGAPPKAVHLGGAPQDVGPGEVGDGGYWTWITDGAGSNYEALLAADAFCVLNPAFKATAAEGPRNPRWTPLLQGKDHELEEAIRTNACLQVKDVDGRPLATPVRHHIPAFKMGRADCLDYLFLAGFNQNIIDFMNQDTSEILDSIDPIYPSREEQSEERFFVRYANHRAMITYVPKSRSLEIGNDYIGACPYAFLIHVLALHNEFLGRAHEANSLERIEAINLKVASLKEGDPHAEETKDAIDQVEWAINKVKLAEFADYERFRYANPFRYDTERDVFAKLEELRGVNRKKEALSLAIQSLEDHASDLQRRSQNIADKRSANRDMALNILLGGTGVFGAGQMIYWIGEKAAGGKEPPPAKPVAILGYVQESNARIGEQIMWWTESFMTVAVVLFFGAILGLLFVAVNSRYPNWLRAGRRIFAASKPRPDGDPGARL